MSRYHHRSDAGLVSIFLVIFTALLVTVVTASFIQLMYNNQQQSSNNDLSQSAYDSAMAGVEDAKRLLVRLNQCESQGAAGATCVNTIKSAIDAKDCQTTAAEGIATFTDGEVAVKPGGEDLNQAYTCVKITSDTEEISGELLNTPTVKSVTTGEDTASLTISWFTNSDAGAGVDGAFVTPSFPTLTTPIQLPAYLDATWPRTQPPVLRVQLIQFKKNATKLKDFNSPGNKYARTAFLYPYSSDGTESSHDLNLDDRLGSGSTNNPLPAACHSAFKVDAQVFTYLCSAKLIVDIPSDYDAYVQLSQYYRNETNGTHYAIRPTGPTGAPLKFLNSQPVVDSTGRASDLFRRVKARISVNEVPSSAFPDAALYVRNNLCKNFFVTDDSADYREDGCRPDLDN